MLLIMKKGNSKNNENREYKTQRETNSKRET